MRILVLLLLLTTVGCSGKKGEDDSARDAGKSDPNEQIEKTTRPTPSLSIWMAYQEDAIAAEEQYGGKVLKISGDVNEISEDTIEFDMFNGDRSESGLPAKTICKIRPGSKEQFTAARKRERFVLIGRCKGQIQDGTSWKGKSILFEDCTAPK